VSTVFEVHAIRSETWRNEAACRRHPIGWWFPDNGGDHAETRRARVICSNCPVREDCLAHALSRNEDGIWGGLNIKERRQLSRGLGAQKILVCQHCRDEFNVPVTGRTRSKYCSKSCREKHRYHARMAARAAAEREAS